MTLIIKEDNLLGRIKFRAFLANSAPPVIVSPIDKAISKTDVDYWLVQADVILAKNVKTSRRICLRCRREGWQRLR